MNIEKIQNAEKLMFELVKNKEQLREMGIIRSEKLEADYVEWRVCEELNLTLAIKSNQKGYDAISKGNTYQIKYIRSDGKKYSSMPEFKNLEKKFDFLLLVILDTNFRLSEIYQVPHKSVKKYSIKHGDSYSFRWKKESKNDGDITKIYPKMRKTLTKEEKKRYLIYKLEKTISLNCSPGWSGYVSEEEFNKEKQEFLDKLTKLFSLEELNTLCLIMNSGVIKLDSGDLKNSIKNKNKVVITNYNKIVFDKDIKSNLVVIIFFGPNEKKTLQKVEKISKQYRDNSGKEDSVLWGLFSGFSEPCKEKMRIIEA